ncbi:hypothetical protein LCGC14_0466740 [marine sediment metagenome]|uniref:Uncharacterized protein n=1 Tax=marine sediment metagenome TaxID=412755 RepID=A0A0F9SIM2_9ZZZZ
MRKHILLLLALLVASPAWAQIALDAATGEQEAQDQTSITFSHTVAGSDRILFVTVSTLDTVLGDRTVSTVTYNAVSMSLVAAADSPNHRSELWFLIAPATGANNVVVTMGGTCLRIWPGAVSYTGVAESSPVEANNTATGSSTTASVAVTTLTNNAWVIDSMGHSGAGDETVGAGQTERVESPAIGSAQGNVSDEGPNTPVGSVTMSWTFGSSRIWATVAAAFKPVGARRPVVVY